MRTQFGVRLHFPQLVRFLAGRFCWRPFWHLHRYRSAVQRSQQIRHNFGENNRANKHQQRSDPMIERKRIAKVHNREQQRHKFAQRHDQRYRQRRTFGGQHINGTNAHVLRDNVAQYEQPLAGHTEANQWNCDRQTGRCDFDVLPDVVVED